MPCHPARARQLVRSGRAVRRFDRGLFYIRLMDRADGDVQPVAVGIDPGSKKEAFTVKSGTHTYLNVQTDAVTWVSERVKTRREMRRGRRYRNAPYRECRPNRRQGSAEGRLPPSTRARWGWKLRVCVWLSRRYPIFVFAVEDVRAKSKKGQRRWNKSFSPLEAGKGWFYEELRKLAEVKPYHGHETKMFRDALGLRKAKDKMSGRFGAHCVDSWVLANAEVGERSLYGGTMSLGLKRGTWVRHPRHGVAYVGGCMNGRISLHSLRNGKRLCKDAKPGDCTMLTRCSWRAYGAPCADRFSEGRAAIPLSVEADGPLVA